MNSSRRSLVRVFSHRVITASLLCLMALAFVPLSNPGTAGATTVCAPGTTRDGIDVSHWQGDIDWAQVAGSGKSFAYAKALEGITFPDDKFVANYAGMKANGIKRGAYLFFRPSVEPATQAYLFLSILQQNGFGAGDLIPAIDVEVTDNLPTPTVVTNLATVVSIVANAIGTAPVIYSSAYFWNTVLSAPSGFALSPLWVAHWNVACPNIPNPQWSNWAFWQHSATGRVPGIGGGAVDVDLDQFNGASLPQYTHAAPQFYAATPPSPASVGAPYTYAFNAMGSPTPTFSVVSGALPTGVSLDVNTGALSGAPTTQGPATFTVQAANGFTPNATTASLTIDVVAAPPAAKFHSLVPARVLDSRAAAIGWSGKLTTTPRSLTVTGLASGVPATASAVIMNVTATGSDAGSFVTAYPAGTTKPNASNLNFGPFQTIPNLVTVKVGTSGQVAFANAVGSTDLVADVVGFFDNGVGTGELFNGVTPARILDSRTANGSWPGKISAGDPNVRQLQVSGRGGVLASATTVVMNVTVTGSTNGSFLEVWPTGTARPNASNLNFAAGQTIPNLVTVQLGTAGQVSFYNAVGATDVIADVVGFFDPTIGNHFFALPTPTRVLDSRVNNGLSGRWAAGQSKALPLTGQNGIPLSAVGIIINTTATAGTVGSFATVYPHGVAQPTSSNLNFGAGETIPNLVMVQVPANGMIDLYNELGYVHLIADAVGYYAP